ncbi:MAG: hypothetical protein KA100_06525 [Rickettsiales bacterium]|nr:hypothetical protein [Rickettsiales bacterium]
MREQFLKISALCSDKNFSLIKLAFVKKKILFHVRFRNSSLVKDDEAVVVEALDKIRTIFKEELRQTQNLVRDKKPMVFWHDKGPVILGSIWLSGLICFAIYITGDGWFGGQIIDYNTLLQDALWITIYIEVVLCSIIAFLLINTSRFHIVLMQLLLCSIGVWMNIVCLLGCANTDFDLKSNDKMQQAVVLQKKVTTHSKSPDEYEINVRDVAENSGPYNIKVTRKFYEAVAEEAVVDVIRKPGFLGYEWIKHVKLSK